MPDLVLRRRAPITESQLNGLFAAAWTRHGPADVAKVHPRSLTWISAWRGPALVGYVNVATDGGVHAFVLDTTVHPTERRRGLGRRLVAEATAAAREAGLTWLHVDYERPLADFYQACGFFSTHAGLIRLN